MHTQTPQSKLLTLLVTSAIILIGQHSIQARDAITWNDKGVNLFKLGKYEEAIEAYDKSLEIDPNYAQALSNKGAALNALDKYKEALPYLNKALEINPKDAFAWTNKAAALGELGKYQEAFDCFDKALDIDAQFVPALSQKGWLLNVLGRHQEAIVYLDKVLKLNPEHPAAWNNKAFALWQLGKQQEAIEYFDKAIKYYEKAPEVDPNLIAQVWDNKGIALRKLGRYQDAEKAARRAVYLEPNNTQYLNNRADSLFQLKRYDNAETVYREAIKIKETWRSYLGLAKIYINLGDKSGENWVYEEALAHLHTVSDLYPEIENDVDNREDYYFQRGYAHVKLGHWREAERDFHKCNGDLKPKAERNINRIRNRMQVEGPPPRGLVYAGWVISCLSLLMFCLYIRYFIRFRKDSSGKTMATVTPTEASLLKYLTLTFMFFFATGLLLPYMKAVRGPAGIGFEKEITIRSELKLEPPPR